MDPEIEHQSDDTAYEDRLDRIEDQMAGGGEQMPNLIIRGIADEAEKRFCDENSDATTWLTYPQCLTAAEEPKWAGGPKIIFLDVAAEIAARAAAGR